MNRSARKPADRSILGVCLGVLGGLAVQPACGPRANRSRSETKREASMNRVVVANRRDGGWWWRLPMLAILWLVIATPIVAAG